MNEPIFDRERLDVYRLAIACAAFSYRVAKTPGGLNRPARGSALECASIHDVLAVCEAIDVKSNRRGNSDLKRIVSMLIRLIQQTETVSEGSVEYVYEYRDAEYEYEQPGHSAFQDTKAVLVPDNSGCVPGAASIAA